MAGESGETAARATPTPRELAEKATRVRTNGEYGPRSSRSRETRKWVSLRRQAQNDPSFNRGYVT